MFRTVREKLIISFLIVAMLPLLILGIITYIHMAHALKEEMIYASGNQMTQLDQLISNIVKGFKEDDRMLSLLPAVTGGEGAQTAAPGAGRSVFSELERYGNTHTEVASVYWATETGEYIEWPPVGGKQNGYDPRKRSWYRKSVSNPDQIIVAEPYQSYNGGTFIISVTTAAKEPNGKIMGVMGIDISLKQLSKMIADCNKGSSNYLFLFNEEGIILAHPDNDMHFQNISALLLPKNTPGEEQQEGNFSDYYKLLHEREGFLETTIDGKKVFVHFQTSAATGWKIAAVIDESVLLAKNRHAALVISSFILLMILFVFGGTTFITLYLTHPLDQIIGHLRKITNGNFALGISQELLKREDEIGEVALAVDSMQRNRYQIEMELNSSNLELAGLYQQLTSTEEELRAQYEELRDKQNAMEQSEERYRLATEGANDAIWDWNIQTGQMAVSKRWLKKLGWANEGKDTFLLYWWRYIHPEDRMQAQEKLKAHLSGRTEEFLCEYRVRNSEGKYVWILTRGKALYNQGIAVRMAGSYTDITENKMRELQIEHMAYYDSLTNIPNRAYIVAHLKEELSSKEAIGAILFIDLDNFKLVNDSFGYEKGDGLLIQVAKRLQEVAGQHVVARLGGDEFILMLKGIVDTAVIENLALAIIQSIDQSLDREKECFMVTSSIGIALYPRDGSRPDAIMRSADLALHQAKKEGKRCYVWFEKKLETEMLEKLKLERGLRAAIRNEEFVLYYQPVVDLQHGRIVGLEALIRWDKPEQELIYPDAFMPIAEESGLIVTIGRWVLKTACLFAKELRDDGQEIGMAVNVSVKELLRDDFVEQVAKVLEETRLPSFCLELEIVETLLIEKFELAIPKLYQLRAMGVQISLDDFGTGYSSLSYLKELPIDTVKIDRTFVTDAMKKKTHLAIIETIIELSHRLQLKVVAEGVETEGQRFFLRKKKCDKIQGYLISKPVSGKEIRNLIFSKN